MKRFTYAMVMAVALIVMVSSFAFAGGEECKSKEVTKVSMGECCIKAAKAGEGCCGKDAEAVKASYASMTKGCDVTKTDCATKTSCADQAACDAAVADMGKCCVAAVEKGEGCCGKDAEALKAAYTEKVAYHKAAAAVKADMHKCCATAMTDGKGCCGHSADELKADFDKKVEAQAKKVASTDKESAKG